MKIALMISSATLWNSLVVIVSPKFTCVHAYVCVCVCIWEEKGLINDLREKRKFAKRVVERRLHFVGYDFNAVGTCVKAV